MAKNILPQKKRVTHIKNMSDNQYHTEGEMQSESYDYVYNIMKGMDSMKSVGYNPSDDSLRMELLSLTNDEYVEVQNLPAGTSSSDCSQTVKTAVIKFKKFAGARKFPLMEKSQKILKQLKHNRSIPKPRAHLACINISPKKDFSNTYKSLPNRKELKQRRVVINEREKSVKLNILTNKSNPVLTSTVISQKSNMVCIVKNKMNLTQVNTKVKANISSKISKPVLTATNVHKSKELNIVKKVDNNTNLKKIPKRCQPANNCIDTRDRNLKTDCNINDVFPNKHMQSSELLDGNSSDGDYERFIKMNKTKKEIPKKCLQKSKKKKVSEKKKTHSKIKLQKSFPSESPDQFDSNRSDDLSDSDDKKKLDRNFSNESLVENYDSNCYSDSSDEGGKFGKVILKKSKKTQPKRKKVQKKKLQCKNKLQKSFPLESPEHLDSTDHDDEKNLERSFSKESLVEHCDSNCYNDSTDEGEEFEKEISKKSKEKQPKEKKVQKKKSKHENTLQKSFPLESSTDTHDSNCLDNLSDGGKKESERRESRVSLESLGEQCDSNCYSATSLGEGGEIDKKIESAVIKSSDNYENILLNNSKIVDANMGSNLKDMSKLQCSLNKDEDKSNYCPFKNFSSEESPNFIKTSDLVSNLDSCVRFEDRNCIASLKPSTMINETSMNCTQNCSQGIPNTNSNLYNSSASKCLSICSNLDKHHKLPLNNLVIDLLSSDSEQENTESSQITVQKEKFGEFKKAQITASTNADSEESDIEVIEVVPVSNRNKPATTCSISDASSNDLNRMTGVDSAYKTYENEIKFSQTRTFDIIQKGSEPMDLDSNVSKNMHPSLEIHLNEKLVKKEPSIVESNNNPVYMTGMCKEYDDEIISENKCDPLGSSAALLKECKLEKVEAMQCVDEDDDITIIEPSINQCVKQENLDDDVIIDYVSVKREQSQESIVEHSVTSKRKNQMSIRDLESKIKNECPVSCKEPKISSIIDSTSVGKELPIVDYSFTKSLIEQKFSSDPLIISKVLPLIELYKKEFIMYQEIVRTEENVEAGLKMVEAHQAEKIKCIQALIQNLVKNHSCFDKIYSDPVKTKEQDALQDPVQLKSFQKYPVDKLQASSSKISSEIHCVSSLDSSEGSLNKLTASLPSVHIKTEKEEKTGSNVDPICLDISHFAARIKTEPGTPINSQASLLPCDAPENKQDLKIEGKKCDVCGKNAIAACQRCAKAFFCSHECGKKFWNDGHEHVCDKYV